MTGCWRCTTGGGGVEGRRFLNVDDFVEGGDLGVELVGFQGRRGVRVQAASGRCGLGLESGLPRGGCCSWSCR